VHNAMAATKQPIATAASASPTADLSAENQNVFLGDELTEKSVTNNEVPGSPTTPSVSASASTSVAAISTAAIDANNNVTTTSFGLINSSFIKSGASIKNYPAGATTSTMNITDVGYLSRVRKR
jgi:hypothetical protein